MASGEAARRVFLRGEEGPARDDAIAPLAVASEVLTISLDELIGRFTHGARAFVRDVLQLRVPRDEDVVSELDPTAPEGLDRFALGEALLGELLAGRELAEVLGQLAAGPIAPGGKPGRAMLSMLATEVREIARIAATYRAGESRDDLEIGLDFEDSQGRAIRLVGRLDQLTVEGRVTAGYRKLSGAAELDLWIRHLTLCASNPAKSGVAARSLAIGRAAGKDQVVAFESVEDPISLLAPLVVWAAASESHPMPFFPEASRTFAKRFEADPPAAWRRAHQTFYGGDQGSRSRPEIDRDRENLVLWEGATPIAADPGAETVASFDVLARSVFAPLLEARQARSE